MPVESQKVIAFLYNRLDDPLIQSNIYLYIKAAAERKQCKFCLVTYEDPAKTSAEETAALQEELDRLGISWRRLRWHQGRSLLLKGFDIAAGFFEILKLRVFGGYRSIVSLGTVAGSFAYLCAVVLRMRLYLYQYEPHSEYTRDVGYWKDTSFGYRLLNWLERRSAQYASVISSGTRHMQARLNDWNVRGEFVKIPSVVNDAKFHFTKEKRAWARSQLGVPMDAEVIFYAGKFGGLYYYEEAGQMFRTLREAEPELFFIVITLNDIEDIREMLARHGITERIAIGSSSYGDIDKYLCAGDFAIVNVPPGPSKQFVSNIKVGEYLCSGMPYLICRGISEDDAYAEDENVGVVVTDFSDVEIRRAAVAIRQFLDEPREELRQRCRSVGIEYRGFVNLNRRFETALEVLCDSSD